MMRGGKWLDTLAASVSFTKRWPTDSQGCVDKGLNWV